MRKQILFIATILICAGPLFPAFDMNNMGARPASMGDAFVALSDDGSGPFYNPAGISQMEKKELDSTYAMIYPGLDINSLSQMFFSLVLPVKQKMAIGLSYAGLSLKDLYSENVFQVTYSQKLDSLWYIIGKNLQKNEFSVGVNVKLLKTGFIVDEAMKADPLFAGKKNGTMQVTFDAGLLVKVYSYQTKKYYTIGLSVLNLTQPDMGIKSEDAVPLTLNLGTGIPIKRLKFMEKISMDNPVLLLAMNYRNKALNFNAGWENSFFNELVFLRLGTTMLEFTAGTGFKFRLSRTFDVILDYAFLLPYKIEGTSGQHILSLRLKF